MGTTRTPRRRVWSVDEDPVAASVRIARAYVDGAHRRVAHARRGETELGRLERDVHEARKALKRARAHLTLVAPLIGRRAAERLEHRCRDVARSLAPARDATAVVAAFDAVLAAPSGHEALGVRLEADLQTLRALVVRERDDALHALLDGAALSAARTELRSLRGSLVEVQTFSSRRSGAKAWARGMERMHGRARRAAAHALAASDEAERAHVARQRWKALGHVLRAYEAAWPAQLGPLAATIEDVCECIGDQHDALVLAERLGRLQGGEASEAAAWVVRRARERGVTLLESALPVLERLAAEPSDAFSERHRGYLRAARRAAQAHASRITPETVSATTP